jgi:hypothetical protein
MKFWLENTARPLLLVKKHVPVSPAHVWLWRQFRSVIWKSKTEVPRGGALPLRPRRVLVEVEI